MPPSAATPCVRCLELSNVPLLAAFSVVFLQIGACFAYTQESKMKSKMSKEKTSR
eukprot:m.110746 g.110746  ORF g.110746 m.110746 type:complete len:55 (-) comp15275_c0_seq1:266-430(-)